jgi:hypothetical protein
MTTRLLAARRPALWARLVVAVAAAVSLSGCIYSAAPILTEGNPHFGKEARFQFYELSAGGARGQEHARYRWDGSRYVFADGDFKDTGAFTMHPFAGRDFIVQSFNARGSRPVEYAVARRLAEGVYLVFPIDERDADAAARAEYCVASTSCRIETQEALLAFARATAAKPNEQGGLALLVANEKR